MDRILKRKLAGLSLDDNYIGVCIMLDQIAKEIRKLRR